MAYTIVIASRYLIPLFLYLFLSCSIYALFVGDVRKQSGAAALQMVFLFLMQFTAWLTIVIRTQQSKYLLFYAFLQILTLALPVLAWFIYPGISRIVMNHMCMLFSAGLIVLTRLDLTKAIKQLIIAGASFVVFLIVPWILRKCRFLEKLGWIYAGIGIAALGIVLILGQVTHGSKLSWSIGGITFQPSEFVKLTFVFFLAAVLSEKTGIRQVVAAGIGATAHVLILVLSKDLGSALILFMVYVFLMTISAHQPLYLAGGLVAGAGASLLAYRMFSHVQVRVQAWRDPWSVIDKQGYQIAQALFAMSRGGLFGLGIGKGTPQDIPYVETDFIFSAVIEELGLEDIHTIHGRAEDYAKDTAYREQYDLCVSRAVANLATLSEYCLPYVKVDGMFVPYKSGEIDEEILGGKIEDVVKFELPGTDIGRSFVKIHKVKNTAKKYPRKAGMPSKEPIR